MKLRHTNPNLSLTSHRRDLYRRNADCGAFPIRKSHHAKKLAIRWHQPRIWRVPIRAAHGLEMAGL
jgi:hypothetical protein